MLEEPSASDCHIGFSKDRPVTLDDLGKILGLSKRAVSQALHERPGTVKVSAATKERVLALAKSMGYRPNTAAKSLTTGRTGMFGIFANTAKMHIRAVHLSVAAEIFQRYQVTPVVINSPSVSLEDMEFCISALINARVDGVLLLQKHPLFSGQHLAELRRYGMSVVQVGSSEPVGEISHYAIDWSSAYTPALEHLIEQGYRKIGGLVGSREVIPGTKQDSNPAGKRTRSSMLESVNEAHNRGHDFEFRIFECSSKEGIPSDVHPLYSVGYSGMKEIIRRGEVPEALMCQVDGFALGAMRACREADLRIPEDMAITGYSNEPVASATYLPLTSIEEPFDEMCRQAVDELVTATRSGSPTARKQVLFPCRLVARQSSLRKPKARLAK